MCERHGFHKGTRARRAAGAKARKKDWQLKRGDIL
jgi:hypothetical protein